MVPRFFSFSVSRNPLLKSENRKICGIWAIEFLELWENVWLELFKLQIMKEKRTPDLLTSTTTFYDVSVSCNRVSKTEMCQFGASGTDGLTTTIQFLLLIPSIIFDLNQTEDREPILFNLPLVEIWRRRTPHGNWKRFEKRNFQKWCQIWFRCSRRYETRGLESHP